MNKPEAAIEAQFNKAGLYFFPKERFIEAKGYQKIGVAVETVVLKDAQLIDIDFMVTVKSKYGTVISITDWEVVTRGDQRLLRFIAWQPIPKGTFAQAPQSDLHFMSFTDLCWLRGNEEVDPDGTPTAETPVNRSYTQADLGWHLPCRFVDPLIDALGKLNDFMLSGTLEDAILYGPITLEG